MGGGGRRKEEVAGKGEDEHLLADLGLFSLFLVRRVDVDGLLSDDLGLSHERRADQPDERSRWEIAYKRTFSIANSSSALTWISRAFSIASCLMKATWGVGAQGGNEDRSARRYHQPDEMSTRLVRTIFFISPRTSSSFSGRLDMLCARSSAGGYQSSQDGQRACFPFADRAAGQAARLTWAAMGSADVVRGCCVSSQADERSLARL